jgi:apolipoprotein N-acyltransferase
LIRLLVIAASGAITALAFPPFDIVPAVFAMAGLAWAVRTSETVRGAAFSGWLWAFGFHVAGLYWISNALLVGGDRYLWMVPFAIAGLPAFLALFTAAAAGFGHRISIALAGPGIKRLGLGQWLLLAGLLGVTEWTRGHVLTGFPWNLPAYAWDSVPAMLQIGSVIGAYGLSLLTIIMATAPALLFDRTVPRRDTAIAIAIVTAVTLGAGVWGGERLAATNIVVRADTIIRVVQGNVPQVDKWNPALRPGHIRRYLELSDRDTQPSRRAASLPLGARPTIVVWPETSVAFLIDTGSDALTALSQGAPEGGALIFGAPRLSKDSSGTERVHNSVLALNRSGELDWVFDKHHLVPFGEYVPFRDILPIDKIVPGMRDFTPGPGAATLASDGVPPVSPLICYEVVFPGRVVAEGGDRPEWLLNLTNDAWYGRSSGPYQHFAISRMRAVEEGLPMVRAANTGISAVIDSHGRVLAQLELGRTGTIDSPLPKSLSSTIYATYGDVLYWAFCFSILCLSVLLLWGGKFKKIDK